MNKKVEQNTSQKSNSAVEVDAVVLGTGFSGLYALYELRRRGLSVKALEAGGDVGGVWYWNRYPGARTDSEASAYCFSFSKELLRTWDWQDRLPSGKEVSSYLKHVSDFFDLRKHIEFDSDVISAVYDDNSNKWILKTRGGSCFKCTYFIAATGPLSAPYKPNINGVSKFEGDIIYTSNWPANDVDFSDKNVGIIGTGSTGVQLLPLIAEVANQVTIFQRTPNYVLPSRNFPLENEHRKAIKSNYSQIKEKIDKNSFAFPANLPRDDFDDLSADERRQVLEAGWEAGGFRFMFETFNDVFTNIRTNNFVSQYIRGKIRSIVQDKNTAELLCPDYVFGAKRPPTGTFYYETFNRQNVTLVDISKNAISRINEAGIEVANELYPFDIIIFATGFEAATGALNRIDLRGRNGLRLTEHWDSGPRTNLGIMTNEFPNLFMVLGPQSPFANAPPVIEHIVEWIAEAIDYTRKKNKTVIEPSPDSVNNWLSNINECFEQTLFSNGAKVGAWYLGANIPGKKPEILFYFGGADSYFSELENTIAEEFSAFDVFT